MNNLNQIKAKFLNVLLITFTMITMWPLKPSALSVFSAILNYNFKTKLKSPKSDYNLVFSKKTKLKKGAS